MMTPAPRGVVARASILSSRRSSLVLSAIDVTFALSRSEPSSALRVVTSGNPVRSSPEAELNILIPGFSTIRDQEPLDDVADCANAVVALLEDEARRNPADRRRIRCPSGVHQTYTTLAWRILAKAIVWSVPSELATREAGA